MSEGRVPTKVLKDRFKLLERIGFGGMGAVYKGHDLVLDRQVAVKELRAEYSEDELLRKRFIREAQAAANLHHPHLVTVHDLVREGKSLFIVMEYLDGGTLLDRMNRAPDRRLDVDVALTVGREALLGLQAAHDAGLVHRDIKPGNIFFDQKGRAKVGDFGVVTARKQQEDQPITTLTQVGTHPGTLVYMAPEQIDGAEVDGRSDVYAMASVLYEALSGARYFERAGIRRTERALMDAICEVPPVPLRARVPYVPEAVERIIDLALSKFIEDRPSAAEMAAELERILSAPRPKPQIVGPGTPPPPPPTGPKDPYAETRPSTGSRPFTPAETQGAATHARRARSDTDRAQPSLEFALENVPPPRLSEPTRERPKTEPLGAPPRTSQPPTQPTVEQPLRASAPPFQTRAQDAGEQILLPKALFVQGSADASDERPPRTVEVDAFLIDRTPVTVAQYRDFLEAIRYVGSPTLPLLGLLYPNGKDHRPQGWGTREFDELCPSDEHPVVLVDWFDACAYAAWVGCRLPSEAEWERAARGTRDPRAFPWGDAAPTHHHAVFGRRAPGPEPVGDRLEGASSEGVLDLAGNVWEWCADRYDPEAYHSLPVQNPLRPVEDAQASAVKRGGSWTNAPVSLRCSRRGFEKLHVRRNNLGFRCAAGTS